jgi:enterochelin esterase-like enzyme
MNGAKKTEASGRSAATSARASSGIGAAESAASSAAASGSSKPPVRRPPPDLTVLDWFFPTELGGDKRAVIVMPKEVPVGVRLPVLVALHGFGESTDPKTGAYGWLKSYGIDRSYQALATAPLEKKDFEGLVTDERLAAINAALEKRPFGGLIVACPYMPREIGAPSMPMEWYGQWIGQRLLPRIRKELPALDGPASTGIDGVSLGGWAALRVGLLRPDLFGVVGTLQAAILDAPQVDWAMTLTQQQLRGRPLHVVTSTDDAYRATLESFDKRLADKGIAHEFLMTQGPHDYPWNKGPGGIEMLLWHDRVLARGTEKAGK